ncbi:formin-like protein 14 [Schistocerca piceifrons]|uniref:formin-like protein 14 n=1 Tax=Schistocerca piceifrons TaxID=274613 RepID=UPI001F5EC61E|nr:formin-like protein 14 [Schistocerca piceifrons]
MNSDDIQTGSEDDLWTPATDGDTTGEVTLACLHASAAQDPLFVLRRAPAASTEPPARGRARVLVSKTARGPAAAPSAASPLPPPPPPPPLVTLPDQPAEPAHVPHRFAVHQRAPTSTSAPPRTPPSPPPPPPRLRLPEQPEEATPVLQRFGHQSRGQPSTPATTAAPLPPPPPPPALLPQPAEVVLPAAPPHRFSQERSTPKPLPAPVVLPQQPVRKITPDVVIRSGDTKADAALEEERRRQAESARYSFGSSLQDSINDNTQSRQETREGLKTIGQYSYSDGFLRRTVHYEADDKGYRVTHEETETIGNGPQVNPNGHAEVESNVGGFHNKYAITIEDLAEKES